MRTVDEIEVSFAELDSPEAEPAIGLFEKLERRKLIIMMTLVAVGLAARLYHIDAAGFAEDEANKLFAIRAYQQGDFTANAEHPMVMKLLCYASLTTASEWN